MKYYATIISIALIALHVKHFDAFALKTVSTSRLKIRAPLQPSATQLNYFTSSQIISVAADYATEIENATVGTEVYGPIFQAGLFLFASGLVSSFIAAGIISGSDSWDGLEQEFQEGKESQFIDNTIDADKTDKGTQPNLATSVQSGTSSENPDETGQDTSLDDLDI